MNGGKNWTKCPACHSNKCRKGSFASELKYNLKVHDLFEPNQSAHMEHHGRPTGTALISRIQNDLLCATD